MNKTELIREVSKKVKLSQKDCELCLLALKDVLTSSLKRGEMVMLSGFGKFFIKHYKERQSYNPKTRQLNALDERFLPVFRASGVLKGQI